MNAMNKTSLSAGIRISACLICFLLTMSQTSSAQAYAVGADLSFMKQAEDAGFVFKENGEGKPCLEIFTDHGYNWIRLRLFHTPTRLPNNLEYTIATAKDAKDRGMKFLLDYHYSDTWADPGKQFLPVAWEGLSHAELVDSVFEYTKATMIAFREAGAFPDMVQVGNEISNGMLWPDGKLPENWDNFAELVQAGINGVYASCGNNPCPEIMIHIDKGGDRDFTERWYDKFHSYGIRYDIIGQSYYPWWHGSLLDTLAPFPETPEGQREWLEEVNRVVLNVPDDRGVGVMWWEPATSRGGTRSFFDREGNVQPVIHVFDKYTRR